MLDGGVRAHDARHKRRALEHGRALDQLKALGDKPQVSVVGLSLNRAHQRYILTVHEQAPARGPQWTDPDTEAGSVMPPSVPLSPIRNTNSPLAMKRERPRSAVTSGLQDLESFLGEITDYVEGLGRSTRAAVVREYHRDRGGSDHLAPHLRRYRVPGSRNCCRSSSPASLGLARPRDAFITWPTRNPRVPS